MYFLLSIQKALHPFVVYIPRILEASFYFFLMHVKLDKFVSNRSNFTIFDHWILHPCCVPLLSNFGFWTRLAMMHRAGGNPLYLGGPKTSIYYNCSMAIIRVQLTFEFEIGQSNISAPSDLQTQLS